MTNENSEFVLYNHCALRSVQLGSLLGVVTSPFISMFFKGRYMPKLGNTMTAVSITAAAGLGGLCAWKINNIIEDENEGIASIRERSYRLYWNRGQEDLDKVSLVSGLAGGLLGGAIGMGYLPGTLAGLGLGAAGFMVNSKMTGEAMIQELKTEEVEPVVEEKISVVMDIDPVPELSAEVKAEE
mmetsp:Transcript_10843/g.11922  ORF Transcript_10843/g.11922 Transcript_10843/m.11922 type:complete len:184 (-) Transcript_10843:129-680(-)